jgi:hypothetical protein
MPDETDRSIMNWRCLELVDVLFRLGENTSLSQTIFQIFRNPGPINKCPDVFGLVIVQLTSSLSQLRLYTLKQVVVQLITSHANAVPVYYISLLLSKLITEYLGSELYLEL